MRPALLFLACAALAAPVHAEGEPPADWRLVDRIVAVVDEDPILLSEIEQLVALSLVERQAGENDDALRRRVLDQLIEQRIRFHEIDRFGFVEFPAEEVEREVEALRAGFASEAEFASALAAVGLDEGGLRQLVARQVIVLTFVEQRLGARVFVGLEDIRAHYETELVPRLTAAGQPVPPLEEVREEIRRVLREQRLNDEIASWTAELRRAADVVDYWEAARPALPPVVAEEE